MLRRTLIAKTAAHWLTNKMVTTWHTTLSGGWSAELETFHYDVPTSYLELSMVGRIDRGVDYRQRTVFIRFEKQLTPRSNVKWMSLDGMALDSVVDSALAVIARDDKAHALYGVPGRWPVKAAPTLALQFGVRCDDESAEEEVLDLRVVPSDFVEQDSENSIQFGVVMDRMDEVVGEAWLRGASRDGYR